MHEAQHLTHLGLAEALLAEQISAFLLQAPVELVDAVVAAADLRCRLHVGARQHGPREYGRFLHHRAQAKQLLLQRPHGIGA